MINEIPIVDQFLSDDGEKDKITVCTESPKRVVLKQLRNPHRLILNPLRFFVLLLGVSCQPLLAQRLPDKTELMASYCWGDLRLKTDPV